MFRVCSTGFGTISPLLTKLGGGAPAPAVAIPIMLGAGASAAPDFACTPGALPALITSGASSVSAVALDAGEAEADVFVELAAEGSESSTAESASDPWPFW